MKKLILLLIFIPLVFFGQVTVSGQQATYSNPFPKPIQVQVTNQPASFTESFNKSFNQGLQAGAAAKNARTAEASARANAYANNYEKIVTDFLIGNSKKYRCIIISKVTGWSNKANRETIFDELTASGNYVIVNPENPKRNFKTIPQSFLESPQTLYLEWHREALGQYDRISNLKLKDVTGKIIFEANYKNKGYSEMLKPLTSDYNYTKELALNKIREYKELKELEVISQKEYDDLVNKLKPIFLVK
jgi:hypothetical protein